MNYGNVGPANMNAQGFEQLSDMDQFNPNVLPTPDKKENDPAQASEMVGNNMNQMNQMPYIDPAMIGNATVQATQYQEVNPAIGQIVSNGAVGMKSLSEEQIIGTDLNASRFQKDGVSKELEEKLDNLKREPNLYRQSVGFMTESKKALSSSFADRGYLAGGKR